MHESKILPNGLAWGVRGDLRRHINVFRPGVLRGVGRETPRQVLLSDGARVRQMLG
jgi:hypothetical protein